MSDKLKCTIDRTVSYNNSSVTAREVRVSVTQSCLTLTPHGLQPTLLCPWNSPSKNTRVDSHSLLQGNLPDLRIESRSPAWQADALPSEPLG